jgi:hypothetical protein
MEQRGRDLSAVMVQLAEDLAAGAITAEQYDALLEKLMQMTDQAGAAADSVEDLHTQLLTIAQTFQGAVVDATLKASDTLIDAAMGAKVSWGDFMKQLLADILKAIARIAILRALSAAGGWWGEAASVFLGGAIARPHPQEEGVSRTSFANTEPGSGPGVGTALQMFNQIVPVRDRESEVADLITDISRAVERRGFHLVASRVLA